MSKKMSLLVAVVLLVLPVIYLIQVYPGLPETIPIHFRLDGTPNEFSGKSRLLWIFASMSGMTIFSCLLFRFLPKIDPKLKGKTNSRFDKITVLVSGIIVTIQIAIIYAVANNGLAIAKIAGVLVGIAVCVCGNLMYNVRPNYFFGIRVPWTLESAENWRATHHVAGKLWFFGGIAMAIFFLVFPALFSTRLLVGSGWLLALVPIIYSFIFFRKHLPK